MNIEEDVIETLNKTIKFYEDLDILYNSKEPCPEIRAIRWIITAYEKEKEKNKELNRLKGFEILDIFNMGKQSSRQRIEFDYVDKEKIKAEIEEARKRYNDLHTKHLRDCGIAEQRELAKIEFGESLLKEE